MPYVGSTTDLRLDLSEGRLRRGDQALPLTPKSFSMLQYFVLHPNRLITKQELLRRMWPDTHVSEDSVKDCVKKIRRVLEDDPARPRFIETARGRGYRFVGDIEVAGAENSTPLPGPVSASQPSIAVLPFVNRSRNPDEDFFAEGMADELILSLSRFRKLLVISRSSSVTYKGRRLKTRQIAGELGVAYLVEGGVRRTADRIRIEVQLVDGVTGHHLWTERYEREPGDAVALQDEVAGTIASTLVGRLEDVGRARISLKREEDLQAYDYLLQGDQHLDRATKGDILQARGLYRRALKLQPSSARAYAGLSISYLEELWSDWTHAPQTAADQALVLARKAVALDPLDSRARVALAAAYHYGTLDFELAEIQFDKAIALNPNDYWAYCLKSFLLAHSGRSDEGISCAAHAIRLNPFASQDCHEAQFVAAYTAGRYEEALTALGHIPDHGTMVNALLGACYAQLGRRAEAGRAMSDFIEAARTKIDAHPDTDPEHWRRYWARKFPFKSAADLNHLLQGLHEAALSGGPDLQAKAAQVAPVRGD